MGECALPGKNWTFERAKLQVNEIKKKKNKIKKEERRKKRRIEQAKESGRRRYLSLEFSGSKLVRETANLTFQNCSLSPYGFVRSFSSTFHLFFLTNSPTLFLIFIDEAFPYVYLTTYRHRNLTSCTCQALVLTLHPLIILYNISAILCCLLILRSVIKTCRHPSHS